MILMFIHLICNKGGTPWSVLTLSTDAFLSAFICFISRRGCSVHLYSHCSTNFITVNKHFSELQPTNTSVNFNHIFCKYDRLPYRSQVDKFISSEESMTFQFSRYSIFWGTMQSWHQVSNVSPPMSCWKPGVKLWRTLHCVLLYWSWGELTTIVAGHFLIGYTLILNPRFDYTPSHTV